MLTKGASVRIVSIIPHDDYCGGESMASHQAREMATHERLIGKQGKIVHVDECRDFPYVVGYHGGRIRVRPCEVEPLAK